MPIPNWCSNFSDVFSEQIHVKLPPHCHYDHTIDLQPTFTPCITKIYPLNPAKLQTCKEFVDEHLNTGQIVPFKSPQASLFFFVPVISHSFLLTISSSLAQLHVPKTWTLECFHSECYFRSLDLHYISPFLSSFWFVYIHTSSCFVHSSNPVPGCVHHSSLQVPGAQPQHLVIHSLDF